MNQKISPLTPFNAAIRLPGDKSISHRYGMLTALAEGTSRIANYASGADCHSTLGAMRSLGAKITVNGTTDVEGVGDGSRLPRSRDPATPALRCACSPRFWQGRTLIANVRRRVSQSAAHGTHHERSALWAQRSRAATKNTSPAHLRQDAERHRICAADASAGEILRAAGGAVRRGETSVTERVQTRDHTELLSKSSVPISVRERALPFVAEAASRRGTSWCRVICLRGLLSGDRPSDSGEFCRSKGRSEPEPHGIARPSPSARTFAS